MIFCLADDIIKQNRNKRRNEKGGSKKANASKDQKNRNHRSNVGNKRNNKNDKNDKMMDTTPISSSNNGIQKNRGRNHSHRRNDSRGSRDSRDNRNCSSSSGNRGNLIVRSNSGRPNSFRPSNSSSRNKPVTSSTPGLRQPWEKLPTAPLPAEPLKISIRNELAEKPIRRSDMMMDTDTAAAVPSRPAFSTSSSYEPRDSLAAREEYRIGNRFSTQGMAIDYQLPSGASYDTRPARRY